MNDAVDQSVGGKGEAVVWRVKADSQHGGGHTVQPSLPPAVALAANSLSDIVMLWWPPVGWTAMLIAYPLEFSTLLAVGALIATVGHMVGVRRKLRPTDDRHLARGR